MERKMRLLGTARSPFAWKVRVALEEKRIPYVYVVAPPADPTSDVSRHNPLGQIPVLVCDDGTAIYDSPVIVEYVDGLAHSPKLIPDDFAGRIAVKRWQALGDGVVEATVLLSRDERQPAAARQGADWSRNQQAKIERALTRMEQDLGGRAFCYGDEFTLADIACGVALEYLDRALPRLQWRQSYEALAAHAERLTARPSFRAGLPEIT
ncbi:MAG: glutathione S-transferase N-terminal domain-containing protein [Xanthobacteraceae bacterium]|nr:glutathione S-transferase N-terminal domain-containing protein [Xanthobacteraceae bacterium]GIK82529.1 MAG: glutathione S-transferase [Alphaproteobacteria bacterium]